MTGIPGHARFADFLNEHGEVAATAYIDSRADIDLFHKIKDWLIKQSVNPSQSLEVRVTGLGLWPTKPYIKVPVKVTKIYACVTVET